MKRNFSILSFLIFYSITGLSQNSIQKTFDKIKAEKILENASFSFRVFDLDADSTIAEFNPKTSLVPASTMKIVTTGAALVKLGSYKTFKTRLQHDGFIDTNGILHGNIVIKGGGDPTLGSKYFLEKDELPRDFMKQWVKEIKELGIDSITGGIIGDASIYSYELIPSSWLWGDIGNYYGAGACGLSIYDNLTTLTFQSGKKEGDPTIVECVFPYLPNLTFNNKVTAANSNRDNAYVYNAPYSTNRLIKGSIPKNREEFLVKASMSDPAYQAAYDLESEVLFAGIKVGKNATTRRKMLLLGDTVSNSRIDFFTHKSPSIGRIAYYTNHNSVNLFAEHLLNEMGRVTYKDGSNYSGSLAVKNFWASKINAKGMYVNDGSGMSRMNAISAYHLTSILRYMKKSKNYTSFYSSLATAGKSGTMRRIGRKTYADGRLRAKSGTMTRVKSYAGYVKSKSGKNLAFAIIANNYNCYNSSMTKRMEKIMVSIANY